MSEPSTPFAFMSRTRFSTSKQPARISSKDVGSIPYSSLGRPATALRPMFGTSIVLEAPDVGAVVLADQLRRDVGVLGREVALEHVGRLHDVVVDAHDDHVVAAASPGSS